ncbi:MAG: hypothetical protein KA604_00100 [Candidatus Saccharimonas sp.]|nr:hypothetical protein [Candidatus Saccharimonas sp.]
MSERPIVNIDMDGTQFDFDGRVTQVLREHGVEIVDASKDFYIANRYSDPEVVALIHDVQSAEGFFRNLEPIDGAIERWYEMIERGYGPRSCTKPLRSNLFCTAEKLAVIDYYFGAKAADAAYIGRDKESQPGIALIDDRPGMTDGREWKRIIFTQPWNTHEDDWRIQSWADPQLWQLLAKCVERHSRITARNSSPPLL